MTTVHCDTLVEPACALVSRVVTSAASSAASDVLSGLANAISTGVRWTVTNTVAWWISIPSPDLAAEPAITRIQAWLLPITAAVAVGAMIAGGLRMVIARQGEPAAGRDRRAAHPGRGDHPRHDRAHSPAQGGGCLVGVGACRPPPAASSPSGWPASWSWAGLRRPRWS